MVGGTGVIDWKLRERGHVRLDPSLRTYVAQILSMVDGRGDADVLDVAAGSGWLGQLDFGSYHGLDIVAPHERWDLNTSLPEPHVGAYDIVMCLGALHFTDDPRRSLAELAKALRPAGELIVAVPWLYPPHDMRYDRWRVSPRQLWRMLDEHFGSVELHPNGSLFQLPLHVLNRVVSGPFRGVPAADLAALRGAPIPEPWRATRVDDVPVRSAGPMVILGRGSNLRSPISSTGGRSDVAVRPDLV